nr:RdRp [Astroviridae sp.]
MVECDGPKCPVCNRVLSSLVLENDLNSEKVAPFVDAAIPEVGLRVEVPSYVITSFSALSFPLVDGAALYTAGYYLLGNGPMAYSIFKEIGFVDQIKDDIYLRRCSRLQTLYECHKDLVCPVDRLIYAVSDLLEEHLDSSNKKYIRVNKDAIQRSDTYKFMLEKGVGFVVHKLMLLFLLDFHSTMSFGRGVYFEIDQTTLISEGGSVWRSQYISVVKDVYKVLKEHPGLVTQFAISIMTPDVIRGSECLPLLAGTDCSYVKKCIGDKLDGTYLKYVVSNPQDEIYHIFIPTGFTVNTLAIHDRFVTKLYTSKGSEVNSWFKSRILDEPVVSHLSSDSAKEDNLDSSSPSINLADVKTMCKEVFNAIEGECDYDKIANLFEQHKTAILCGVSGALISSFLGVTAAASYVYWTKGSYESKNKPDAKFDPDTFLSDWTKLFAGATIGSIALSTVFGTKSSIWTAFKDVSFVFTWLRSLGKGDSKYEDLKPLEAELAQLESELVKISVEIYSSPSLKPFYISRALLDEMVEGTRPVKLPQCSDQARLEGLIHQYHHIKTRIVDLKMRIAYGAWNNSPWDALDKIPGILSSIGSIVFAPILISLLCIMIHIGLGCYTQPSFRSSFLDAYNQSFISALIPLSDWLPKKEEAGVPENRTKVKRQHGVVPWQRRLRDVDGEKAKVERLVNGEWQLVTDGNLERALRQNRTNGERFGKSQHLINLENAMMSARAQFDRYADYEEFDDLLRDDLERLDAEMFQLADEIQHAYEDFYSNHGAAAKKVWHSRAAGAAPKPDIDFFNLNTVPIKPATGDIEKLGKGGLSLKVAMKRMEEARKIENRVHQQIGMEVLDEDSCPRWARDWSTYRSIYAPILDQCTKMNAATLEDRLYLWFRDLNTKVENVLREDSEQAVPQAISDLMLARIRKEIAECEVCDKIQDDLKNKPLSKNQKRRMRRKLAVIKLQHHDDASVPETQRPTPKPPRKPKAPLTRKTVPESVLPPQLSKKEIDDDKVIQYESEAVNKHVRPDNYNRSIFKMNINGTRAGQCVFLNKKDGDKVEPVLFANAHTHHQGPLVLVDGKTRIALPPKEKWIFSEPDMTLLPYKEFPKQLKGLQFKPLNVSSKILKPGDAVALVGYHFNDESYFASTNGRVTSVARDHSAFGYDIETGNHSCGSICVDVASNGVVGIHYLGKAHNNQSIMLRTHF